MITAKIYMSALNLVALGIMVFKLPVYKFERKIDNFKIVYYLLTMDY